MAIYYVLVTFPHQKESIPVAQIAAVCDYDARAQLCNIVKNHHNMAGRSEPFRALLDAEDEGIIRLENGVSFSARKIQEGALAATIESALLL